MNPQAERPASRLLTLLALTAGLTVTLFPFLYMLSTALKGQVYIFEYPPRLIPAEPTLQNFVKAWTANRFDIYFRNSVVVTVTVTGLVLLLSSLMAYAFARFEFRMKRWLYAVILILMMIPAMTLIVPQFMLASRLKLLNSLWGLIVVYTAQNLPLNTFLLRGFFEQIPVELEEAALIDGASAWDVYRRIILPLSKPALATVAIFASLGAWDEYVWAMTILNQADKRTLPVGIATFHGVHATDWGLVFAASLIAIVPILILFVLLQRYFIKGAITGAIKG
ncbi:MAG: carbohydrate ABC transporter permease [Anaerolineales bacterium]|nr:carbohydrate ABC transporter permease [Anaerolineales bacterium]